MPNTTKTPSERDQRIYWQVRGRFRTQRDVAKEFNMTQPRVCQIVRDVAAHFAGTMPGLELCLSEAEQLRLMSRECVERRQRLILRAEEEYEASKRPLVTTLVMEKRKRGWKQKIERGQRGDVRLLKIMQQENDRLASWAEKKMGATAGLPSSASGRRPLAQPLLDEPAVAPGTPAPITPTTGRGFESLDTSSPEYVFYPHRSEGEMSACMLAQVVVEGGMTPAEYIQRLEWQELEKPLVCPLALAPAIAECGLRNAEWESEAPAELVAREPIANCEMQIANCKVGEETNGTHSALRTPHSALARRWRVREREELRPPSPLAQQLLDEGKHASQLDAATQAALYQPHLSRAEYYATIRREMLGEGMLSPDEFATLSVWASRLPGGLPAEGALAEGRLINAAGAIAECGLRNAEKWEGEAPAEPSGAAAGLPSSGSAATARWPTTAGRASSGTPSTRERLLAAGKPLSDRTRARWERKIERREARRGLIDVAAHSL